MGFVNEKLTEKDKVKYGMDAIEKKRNAFFPTWIVNHKKGYAMFRTGLNKERNTTIWLHFFEKGHIEIHAEEKPGSQKYEILGSVSV